MSGPPAAGKTTNARPLADALGLPLFAHDPIKERLADHIGRDALTMSDELGRASVLHMLATAHEILDGGDDVMVEGFFRAGEYDEQFAPLIAHTRAVLIHLWAEDLLLKDRYEERALAQERHWIHGDEARIGKLLPELPEDMRKPLDLGVPRIFVNTSHRTFDPATLRDAVLAALKNPHMPDYRIGDMS